MRSYPLHEARAEFSRLVARALDGEPQRVTRYGREAVVIVSEADWARQSPAAPTLADLFLEHAGDAGYDDALHRGEVIADQVRPPGADFVADEP